MYSISRKINIKWVESDSVVSRVNLIQIGIWTVLALFILPSASYFLYDEAFFWNEAYRVFHELYFPVYGPFVSETVPKVFTPGGGLYLVLSIPFVLSADPRWGIAWLILLSGFSLIYLDFVFRKISTNPVFRFFTVSMLTWSVWHAHLLSRIWNVHLYWLSSVMLFASVLKWIHRKNSALDLVLIGVFSALSCQIHAGGVLILIACFLTYWTYRSNQIKLKDVLWIGCGFTLMYFPYLIYELLHGFPNETAILHLQKRQSYRTQTLIHSLKDPLIFLTHFTSLSSQKFHEIKKHLFEIVLLVNSFGTLFLFFWSFLLKKNFARVGIFAYFTIPVFLTVLNRSYFHHYVSSLLVLFFVATAAAATDLFKKFKYPVFFHIIGFSIFGAVTWMNDFIPGEQKINIAKRIQNTQNLIETYPNMLWKTDEEFIYWSIAKNIFKKEPRFWVEAEQKYCPILIGLPTQPHQHEVSQNSYFDCRL